MAVFVEDFPLLSDQGFTSCLAGANLDAPVEVRVRPGKDWGDSIVRYSSQNWTKKALGSLNAKPSYRRSGSKRVQLS